MPAVEGQATPLSDQPVQVVKLARVPQRATRFTECFLLSFTTIVLASTLHRHIGGPKWPLTAVIIVTSLPLAWEILRRLRLARAVPLDLCLADEAVYIRAGNASPVLRIPYDQVLSVERYGWLRPSLLLFSVGRMPLDLRGSGFVTQADMARVESAVVEGIRRLPDGLDRLRAAAERKAAGALVFRSVPWMSVGLGAVLVMLFALQDAVHATTDLERILVLGASSGELLLRGEIMRLAAPALLHVDLTHLGLNVVLIAGMGALMEGFLGRARWIVLVGLASVVAYLASSLVNPAGTSVGASGAVAGLFGAILMVNATRRDEIPSMLRLPWPVLAALVGCVFASEFSRDDIDHLAHAGSLVAGALLYRFMVHGRRLSSLPTDTPSGVTRLAWVVAGVYIVAGLHIVRAAVSLGTGAS